MRQNRLSLCWGLRGSNEPYVFYQINRNLSTKPPLDKSGASAIIKITKDTSTSGCPRLKLWKRKKSRNRHFAEWRFRPLMRIVTVNPKIWKVNVIGIGTPPLQRIPGKTARRCVGALGVQKNHIYSTKQIEKCQFMSPLSPPLDKSQESAIIKPQGHHDMRRPGSY